MFVYSANRVPILLNHVFAALAGAIGFICIFSAAELMVVEWYFLAGLIILLLVAPYIFGGSPERSVWLYIARIVLAAFLSGIAALIFGGGLSAIAEAYRILFEVEIDRETHPVIWSIAILFVAPVFGLSLTPQSFADEIRSPVEGTLVARAVGSFINYLITPVLLVYFLIILLYSGKILVEWSLPKGQVATISLVFSIGLTAFILFARPFSDRANIATRFLLSRWHILLIVPLILLSIAVFRRVSDYGLTPERYGLMIAVFWTCLLIVGPFLFRAQMTNRAILATSALLLLGASIGPWGAIGYSISNQVGRLHAVLERSNLIENGVLVEEAAQQTDISELDKVQARSIVRFLAEHDSLDRLKPLFLEASPSPFFGAGRVRNPSSWQIQRALGIATRAKPKRPPNVYSPNKPPEVTTTSVITKEPIIATVADGMTLVGPIRLNRSQLTPVSNGVHTFGAVKVAISNEEFEIRTLGQRFSFGLSDVRSSILENERLNQEKLGSSEPRDPIIVRPQGDPRKASLIIEDATLRQKYDDLLFDSVRLKMWLVIERQQQEKQE
ncbi:MAG: DUF4153 domain-containing protein [Pseudomonadota bacterium]